MSPSVIFGEAKHLSLCLVVLLAVPAAATAAGRAITHQACRNMQKDANLQLSANQRRFLAAMLTARTVTDAARQAGIAERTAYLYLSTPHVQAALNRALDEALSHTAQQATAAMDHALAALRAILDDPASPPAARIAAARTILQVGPRLHESVTLTQRVAILENQPKDSDLWF